MLRSHECGSDRMLFLVAAGLALSYWAVVHFEVLNEQGASMEVIDLMERYAAVSVPNYKKIWFARSLLWQNTSIRGQKLSPFGLALLKEEALVDLDIPGPWLTESVNSKTNLRKAPNLTLSLDEVVRPWSTICSNDSDGDGFTNGEELGDPCCIWKPGMATAWSFHITHPGYGCRYCHKTKNNTMPPIEAQEMIRRTDCAAVRKAGHYVPSDEDFFFWYYREHFEDIEYGGKMLYRISILTAHALLVIFWGAKKKLWREFSATQSHRHLSLPRLCVIIVCAYLFVDLASAFVHAFLDNCYIQHPIVGPMCKAFQFHHYHPRSLSVAPVIYWITHTLEGALPLTGIYVVLGLHYQLPKEIELFVGLTAIFWPLTYCWHNLAHLPDSERMLWFKGLQYLGLALSSEAHFVHHRLFDKSWSSMAGIMDWVPNLLVEYFYDRQNAIATWNIIFCMLIGPWYIFFMYYVILGRGLPIASKLTVGGKCEHNE
eukprot:gnl/MRDRNA2_/MRDRNA2_34768_c0_seq1.p1 gnl/MRDRNA2_/MRDRNA2_34768_c0~~gnl/MRDRNA2_/MRDRNA2_34768_c0_seq1.p1  ORF type:complete len:512 (-),score=45.46 gnl/MRDRNA2_/MRDRNA2_34768_c0_seq1:513-1970(-)